MGDRFVDGWTESELSERFDACQDLVVQLTVYCKRKLTEQPHMSTASLLPKVRASVEQKGWDLTGPELDWVMQKVEQQLNGDGDAR